jgi:transposase, IS5 family
MQRDFGQMSFGDGLINQRKGRNEWLDDLDKMIDWSPVKQILKPIYASDAGKPSYPHLTMFKLLLLGRWYDLSDEGIEEAVDDRLSFRRFARLPLDRAAPDHSTIWRFRDQITRLALHEALFAEVNRQLDSHGLILRKGTLIDATIVRAAVKPPHKEEGQVTSRDPDAGFTRKHGKSYFGYKGHIGVDQDTDLIRKTAFTSADVHDSVPADSLISGDEAAAYGDKAYDSKERRERLQEAGIEPRLMYKAARNRPLKSWQEWFNKAVSPIRSGVERPFGRMKGPYGYVRVRFRGLARNHCDFNLMALAMNLRRGLALYKQQAKCA